MGCFTCIKVLMVLFNLLIFLAGGTLLGVGIWVSVDSGSFLKIFGSLPDGVAAQFVNVGYFLIAIGGLLVILGFLGCCGAQRESKCLLITFFTIVLIIFIAEIAGAVVALVYSSVARDFLKSVLTPVIRDQYGVQQDVTKSWDNVMNEFKCCGLNNYTDFSGSAYTQKNNGSYPPQCCNSFSSSNSTCSPAAAAGANATGCFDQILNLLKKNAAIVGGIAAGICALELAAMVVSMYLYCRIDKQGSIH